MIDQLPVEEVRAAAAGQHHQMAEFKAPDANTMAYEQTLQVADSAPWPTEQPPAEAPLQSHAIEFPEVANQLDVEQTNARMSEVLEQLKAVEAQ